MLCTKDFMYSFHFLRTIYLQRRCRGIPPLAMKKTCTCGGSFRLITKEHVINTRIEHLREIVLLDIKYNQCKICGKTELEKFDEIDIELLKTHLSNKHFSQNVVNH